MTPAFIPKTWTERTCLKWSADGSLSEHDHDELIKRLCSADPEMSKSRACGVHQDATSARSTKNELSSSADRLRAWGLPGYLAQQAGPQRQSRAQALAELQITRSCSASSAKPRSRNPTASVALSTAQVKDVECKQMCGEIWRVLRSLQKPLQRSLNQWSSHGFFRRLFARDRTGSTANGTRGDLLLPSDPGMAPIRWRPRSRTHTSPEAGQAG